ncbi:MAG: 6-pyruvoyl trahydropterin synthase family protein [Planctomycetota bacterium]
MSEFYQVRVDQTHHVFSAAHFITVEGNVCERLHGHNYRVWVEVDGELGRNQYVIDFIALNQAVESVIGQLDHHTLLPTLHPVMCVVAGEREVEVRFSDRRWLFPRGDCVLLPISNTTTELIARHIAHCLLDDLQQRIGARPRRLRVGVDENHGQWGICELRDE